MIHFCTLFNSNYLTRGLALYESLEKVCPSFHLYVIAFDQESYNYLRQAQLPHLTPVSLSDFEDEQLLRIKPTRSAAEYCWTCTPSVVRYCIDHFRLPFCIYVDADLIFYQNPQVILDEMGDRSILLTEHRYTPEYDQSKASGIYCVQFLYFKNNPEGRTALEWWRERCIEWCYAREEEGKFGDQKYLDDWTSRFRGVHVMENAGGGIAPWNVQQFQCVRENGEIRLVNKQTGKISPLVFFHFHGVKFFSDKVVSYSGTLYELDPDVKKLLYRPYIEELQRLEMKVRAEGIQFNVNGARENSPSYSKTYFFFVKERLKQLRTGRISLSKFIDLRMKKHYHFTSLHGSEQAN